MGEVVSVADDDELSAMEVFSDVGTALGLAQSLESIFDGGGGLSAQAIAALVAQEVADIFFEQTAATQISDAAAALDTVRQFLGNNYLNAKNAGETTAELYALLNSSQNEPLYLLQQQTDLLASWLNTAGVKPAQGTGTNWAQAVSVGLGLAVHSCLVYRELAAVSPDDPTKNANLANMQDTARIAIQGDSGGAGFQAGLENALSGSQQAADGTTIWGRLIGLIYNYTSQGLGKATWQLDLFITDNWAQNPGALTLETTSGLYGTYPNASDALAAMRQAMDPIFSSYLDVLWEARQQDCDALTSQINAAGLDATVVDNIVAFGQWAQAARDTLMALDLIATGLNGDPEDGWYVCGNCGAVFHGLDPLSCPAGGTHSNMMSPNFVLHQQASTPADPTVPTPPPQPWTSGATSGWGQCANCNGLVALGTVPGGGFCFPNGSALPPPGGGNPLRYHSPQGNYFVCSGDVPDPSQRGIANAQGGFFSCATCGLLCFSMGPPDPVMPVGPLWNLQIGSVCPVPWSGGEPHAPFNNAPTYWLSSIALFKGATGYGTPPRLQPS